MFKLRQYLFLFFSMIISLCNLMDAQPVWSEDFNSYPNGTTAGAGNRWTSSCPGCGTGDHFEVISGAFEGLDVNAFATWESETIDVSACSTFTFSLDAIEVGDHEGPICACGINIDYFDVSYSINGGAFTIIQNWNGDGDVGHTLTGDSQNGTFNDNDWGSTTVSAIGLNGNSLALRVEVINTSGSERLILDNVSVACETLLPAEWVYFEAERRGEQAALHWKVAIDEYSHVFEVERSTNGRDFQVIDRLYLQAEGEDTFAYFDQEAPSETVFYRIHHVSQSGESSFSEVAELAGEPQAPGIELLQATLSGTILSLRLTAEFDQKIQLSLISLAGQSVFYQEKSIKTGDNRFLLDLGSLAQGMYVLRVQGERSQQIRRLIID
jgi:hypothetical protein